MNRFKQNPIAWIMSAVLVWGTILAIGAYRFNYMPMRFVMVFGSTVGFLLFWTAALRIRQRRLDGERHAPDRDF
jgi:hypothetical protein